MNQQQKRYMAGTRRPRRTWHFGRRIIWPVDGGLARRPAQPRRPAAGCAARGSPLTNSEQMAAIVSLPHPRRGGILQLRDSRLLSRGAARSASGQLKVPRLVIATSRADLGPKTFYAGRDLRAGNAQSLLFKERSRCLRSSKLIQTVCRREEPERPFNTRWAPSSTG